VKNAGGWLALAALTVFPFSFDNFELPHQVVLVLGALALSYGMREVPRAFAVALALVVGAAVITTLTSRSSALSTPGLFTLLVAASFGLVSLDLSWRLVLWTTWPIAAWAFAQGLGLDPIEWGDAARWCGGLRPFATFGHPTQLGVWMAAVCVLAVDDAVKRRSWPMGLTALLAAVTCGVTLSRAGWLALAVGLLTLVALSPRGEKRVARVAAGFTAVALALVTLIAKGPAVLERLTHFFVAPTRVQLWTTALAGFREHPMLGWGFDTFALVDQQFRHPDAWRYEWGGTAGHAHSLLPQMLATEGLLGLGAALVAVVVVLRAWRRHSPHRGALAVVLALGAASMVTFFGIALTALGLAALVQSLEGGPRLVLSRWLQVPVLLVAAVTVMMFGASVAARAKPMESVAARLEPWNAQWPALQGEALERAGRLSEARQAYEHAQHLAPLGVFEANVGRVAARQGDGAASRAAFEQARRHAPLDGRIALDASEASARLGDVVFAEATLSPLLALYPSDGPAWLLLGRLRLQLGRVVEGRAALEASLAADWRDWPEGLGQARALLAHLLAQTGDPLLAEQVERGPDVFALPGDACGAPSLLRR
jgi:O-antigen ligase/Flp pilus assembly protein TadD